MLALPKTVKRRNRWQDKRKRQLKKLENMRAAKARKRMAGEQPEVPPKMVRWHRFELGIRDKITGRYGYGEAWTDFKSIRDSVRRLQVIQRHCINKNSPVAKAEGSGMSRERNRK